MTNRYVLLLRGINVGPTTKVLMSDLRELLEELGYSNVRTILQSGNVVLDSSQAPDVRGVESAIAAKSGVKSRVVSVPLEAFRALVSANPLLEVSDDLSKLVITFLDDDIVPARIERPTDAELDPERLVVAARAVYQWCPNGILQSRLKPGWWRQFGPVATTRNVRTAERILAAADLDSGAVIE